jgi:hypothetical protein
LLVALGERAPGELGAAGSRSGEADYVSPAELIQRDHWASATGETEGWPYFVRYREPLLEPPDVGAYPRCLRVLWAYDDAESGSLPTSDDSDRMKVFEDRLCTAWEDDAVAVLTAVLTFDGTRQWVFYTANVPECAARLNAMPQEPERYPVELDVFDDVDWEYLRSEVVGDRVPV